MLSVSRVAHALQTVLTTTANDAAREKQCIKRRRAFDGASLCQTLVFGWLGNPDATLDELCQMAARCGASCTAQGLDQRFSKPLADTLKVVLDAAVMQVIATTPAAIPLFARFNGVYLQDSSVLTLPSALAVVWQGCGDATETGHSAVLKLSARLDLCSGALHGPVLHNGRVHDRTAAAALPALPAGSLRLADLGYFAQRDLAALDAAGGLFLTRIQVGTGVRTTADGPVRTLRAVLEEQRTDTVELSILLGAVQQLPCRLLAQRVPETVAAQRRRRLKAEAKRRGETVSADRKHLAAWTIMATNVPAARLTLQEALVLLRARWQVELLFKLWKSTSQIDTWRTEKPWRILCEVYAKLIGVVIQHWLLLTGCWSFPDRSLVKAASAVRDAVAHLAATFSGHRRLCAAIRSLQCALQAGCRVNHRKALPSAFQLWLGAPSWPSETLT